MKLSYRRMEKLGVVIAQCKTVGSNLLKHLTSRGPAFLRINQKSSRALLRYLSILAAMVTLISCDKGTGPSPADDEWILPDQVLSDIIEQIPDSSSFYRGGDSGIAQLIVGEADQGFGVRFGTGECWYRSVYDESTAVAAYVSRDGELLMEEQYVDSTWKVVFGTGDSLIISATADSCLLRLHLNFTDPPSIFECWVVEDSILRLDTAATVFFPDLNSDYGHLLPYFNSPGTHPKGNAPQVDCEVIVESVFEAKDVVCLVADFNSSKFANAVNTLCLAFEKGSIDFPKLPSARVTASLRAWWNYMCSLITKFEGTSPQKITDLITLGLKFNVFTAFCKAWDFSGYLYDWYYGGTGSMDEDWKNKICCAIQSDFTMVWNSATNQCELPAVNNKPCEPTDDEFLNEKEDCCSLDGPRVLLLPLEPGAEREPIQILAGLTCESNSLSLQLDVLDNGAIVKSETCRPSDPFNECKWTWYRPLCGGQYIARVSVLRDGNVIYAREADITPSSTRNSSTGTLEFTREAVSGSTSSAGRMSIRSANQVYSPSAFYYWKDSNPSENETTGLVRIWSGSGVKQVESASIESCAGASDFPKRTFQVDGIKAFQAVRVIVHITDGGPDHIKTVTIEGRVSCHVEITQTGSTTVRVSFTPEDEEFVRLGPNEVVLKSSLAVTDEQVVEYPKGVFIELN